MIISKIVFPFFNELTLSYVFGIFGTILTLPQLLSSNQINWIDNHLKMIDQGKLLNIFSSFNFKFILFTSLLGLILFFSSFLPVLWGENPFTGFFFFRLVYKIIPNQFHNDLINIFLYKLSFPFPQIRSSFNFTILIVGYILLVIVLFKLYLKTDTKTNTNEETKTKRRIKYSLTILFLILPYVGFIWITGTMGVIISLVLLCLSLFILFSSVVIFYFILFVSRNNYQRISGLTGFVLLIMSYSVK